MAVSIVKKREVTSIWLDNYPSLYPYTNDKLYMILGGFVMGIELIKLPRVDEYRPHFVLYPLYGNSLGYTLKACMTYPVLLLEFFNKAGLQYSISYENDAFFLQNVIQEINEYLPFKIQADVKISSFHNLIDLQLRKEIIKKQLKQPDFFEIKYYSALYISSSEAESVLMEIKKDSLSWNMKQFESYYGDFKQWYKRLQAIDRNDFIAIIENNKQEIGNKKLAIYELI